jgi:hypothetical protein
MTFTSDTGLIAEPMLSSRLSRRSLHVVALTLSLVALSIGAAAAQTTTKPTTKPHTKPAAQTQTTAPPTAQGRDHVYLLRGAFNIFSLGMDEIADRLGRMGIYATVNNYLSWQSLADEAAADYKAGRVRNIVIVGHSSGAIAVTEMAARLGELGVPVKLAIGLDPTSREVASGNVGRYINYYIANGMGNAVVRGKQFNGVLQNVDVEKNPALGHFNIDKNPALQDLVIREIRAAL